MRRSRRRWSRTWRRISATRSARPRGRRPDDARADRRARHRPRQTAFAALTRSLAHRGSAATPAGHRSLESLQHLAIVIDDRIVSVPYIDFRQAPDGIDGSAGAQISGGLTPETARRLAALLSAGPLAADLVPAG